MKNYKSYRKSIIELNAIIEKKFEKFFKNKEREKTEKKFHHFLDLQISYDESKKSGSSLA